MAGEIIERKARPRHRSTAQFIATVDPASVSAGAIKAQPAHMPLDPPAAVVYGKFINAAYDMFEKPIGDPLEPTPRKGVFPEGYRLTAWLQMSDFVLNQTYVEFYGFIATEIADPRSHVLAMRGTEGWHEWLDDAACWPVPFKPVPEAGLVHYGFNRIYRTLNVVRAPHPLDPIVDETPSAGFAKAKAPPLSQTPFADQVEALLSEPPDGGHHHFVVAGHSLGAALCTLYVMEHAVKKKRGGRRKVMIERVCTFASPRVALPRFRAAFDALPIDAWRIVNRADIVPMVPPVFPIPFRHVEVTYPFCSCRMARWSPVCAHSMLTYMHWLDPNVALLPGCEPRRRAAPAVVTPPDPPR